MATKGTDAAPILAVEKLKTYYPVRKGSRLGTHGYIKAVDGVDFRVYPGETLGIVGESGCGKSTLGKTIMGLEKPYAGHIFFQGRDIAGCSRSKMRKVRNDLQIIFQDPYSFLNPCHRVADILAEPLIVHHIVPRREVDREVDKLLDSVGLSSGCRDRYPNEFSGGQRQRIGIARALALRPKLIICDEPVSALDVSIQAQVLNLLKDLQERLGLTYLFIAHGLGAVRYISDRVAIMYLGRIVEIGTADEIFCNPRHPYTQALLSAYLPPDPGKRDRDRIILEGDVPGPAQPPAGCRFQTRCRLAGDMCRARLPELSEEEHAVACFLSQG